MKAKTPQIVRVRARIIHADGTVTDLGTIAQVAWWKRAAVKLKNLWRQ